MDDWPFSGIVGNMTSYWSPYFLSRNGGWRRRRLRCRHGSNAPAVAGARGRRRRSSRPAWTDRRRSVWLGLV